MEHFFKKLSMNPYCTALRLAATVSGSLFAPDGALVNYASIVTMLVSISSWYCLKPLILLLIISAIEMNILSA